MESQYDKIYEVPFEIDNCPLCGQPLAQPNMTDAGNGRLCQPCEALFIKSTDCNPDIATIRKFLVPYNVDALENFNSIPFAYKQYVLFGDEDIRIYTILCGSAKIFKKEGYILHNSDDYQRLLSAEVSFSPIYRKSSQRYVIVKTRFSKYIASQKKYIENMANAATLKRDYLGYLPGYNVPTLTSKSIAYLYRGLNPCSKRNHPVSGFWALFDIPGFDDEDFYIEYCHKCQRFLMSADDYKDYLKRLRLFPMRVKVYGTNYDPLGNEREEISLLKLAGYTVDRSYGYTSYDRQKILAYILDSRTLDKTYILNHLRSNIEYNGRNPYMDEARDKWIEDRIFVQRYRLRERPLVLIGKIKTVSKNSQLPRG